MSQYKVKIQYVPIDLKITINDKYDFKLRQEWTSFEKKSVYI